ncbi:MAG: DUF6861 domain-containing protein [Gammaproteobacteria bacterium]
MDGFINKYDSVYNDILNNDILSDTERKIIFNSLKNIRNAFIEINLLQRFYDDDKKLQAAYKDYFEQMDEHQRQTEDLSVFKELSNTEYYQKIIDAEEQQAAIEKGIAGQTEYNTLTKETLVDNTITLIQNASITLDKITTKVAAITAEQNGIGGFFRRAFDTFTKGAAVGASLSSIGVSAAGGALVGGTIGASFFGVGAIPGAIIGAAIAGASTTIGLGVLGGLGWIVAKSSSSSDRKANKQADDVFKTHLRSLIERNKTEQSSDKFEKGVRNRSVSMVSIAGASMFFKQQKEEIPAKKKRSLSAPSLIMHSNCKTISPRTT